jgi:uncharacterized protein (TIGR02302 family)
LPGWLHAGLLGAFVIAGLIAFGRLFRLSWPGVAEARLRLERDSGLAHRPLQTLADSLSAGADEPLTQALWQAEHRRLRQLIQRLSLKSPAPELARHDPWGLRFASLLLLAIALSGGWHDATSRLLRAMRPNLVHLGGAATPVLQVWATPPAYTGKAPILLDDKASGRIVSLPTDTSLLAVLQGGHGQAQLFIDDERSPFQQLDNSSQRVETKITKGGRLLIRQGHRQIGNWTIALWEIQPPSIAFATQPETDREGRLRLDIEGQDSYGISKAWAVIRRTDNPDAPPLSIALPIGGAHPTTLRQAAWHDLTGHPWAGLPVIIEPVAENVAGRSATGPSVRLTLPERIFTNPVARAIVSQRRVLTATPERRQEVAEAIIDITSHPDSFGNDLSVYLALSTAVSRLVRDRSPEAVPSVILWQSALTIEEGDKPAAKRALDEAARDLEKALADGASQSEIDRLTTQLQAAMARYLDALVEQAKRQGVPIIPDNPEQASVSAEELDGMIERMRVLSRTGSSEAARQMLSELRQMLDGLGTNPQGGLSEQQAHQAQQTLQDLQAITSEQRQLLDETFRRAQKTPGAGGKAKAQRQEALRKHLGQVLQTLESLGTEIPNALGQAEEAMRDSAQALRQDEIQDAIDAQTEAVERLQEGARMAAQSLAKRMGSGMVRQGAGRDPLGRPLPGRGDGDDHSVNIPNQSEVQKAREVLDELRRRAGQTERPSPERDYLQRLLRQFF